MTKTPAEGALFILTNRMNLNGMLSSRIIGPRESFGKYYRDLLELTGGSIPLLADLPSQELVDYVSEKVRTGPALLQLTPRPHGDGSSPVFLTRAVPFSAVTAIHLPDDKSMREHLARRYNNVHPHEHLLTVSPQLFQGTVKVAHLEAAVATSSQTGETTTSTDTSPATDWQRLDRVRGAMSAAVYAATTAATLRTAAAVLPGSAVQRTPLGAHLQGDDHATDDTDPDDLLTRTVIDIFARTDVAQAWNPREVVEHIADVVKSTNPSQAHLDMIDANLATVRAVVTNEREFTPFRETTRGLRSAKALLLVLLREELSSLLSWPETDTGADDHTLQLAAVFAGTLRGLSREAVAARSMVLDDHTARWACRTESANEEGSSEIHTEQSGQACYLVAGSERVRSAPISVAERFEALSTADQEALAPQLVEILGAHDSVTVKVRSRTAQADVSKSNELIMTFPGDAVIERSYDLDRLIRSLSDSEEAQAAAINNVIGSVLNESINRRLND